MKAWKTKLPDEDRWKVMAFERTFGLTGKGWDPTKKDWVPAAEVGGRAAVAAPAAAPTAMAALAVPAGKSGK